MSARVLWAPWAWWDGRWHERVRLEITDQGHFGSIESNCPCPPQAERLPGPVLPGVVNAHSHAFQRCIAAWTQERHADQDDFWSWRDRMYRVALQISPQALHSVAAQLYAEMLEGGYTHVCEFHYLHHQPGGQPYDDVLCMSHALIKAAQDVGIGLTMLPVLYERAGFSQSALRPDQRRFGSQVDQILEMARTLSQSCSTTQRVGLALHSLRACMPESIQTIHKAVSEEAWPIHIHVAEQVAEVQDCLASTGMRPIEWLTRQVGLDSRWHLVHATHTVAAEIEAVARQGAGIVVCPTTEADLGDGVCDLPSWLQAGVSISVGSDSHVCRNGLLELRWLEYGQRLALHRRNVAAHPTSGMSSTAQNLWQRIQAAAPAPAGLSCWGLRPGARADWLVVDPLSPGLLGVPGARTLEALMFACDLPRFIQVGVAGKTVVNQGRHILADSLAEAYGQAVASLSAD